MPKVSMLGGAIVSFGKEYARLASQSTQERRDGFSRCNLPRPPWLILVPVSLVRWYLLIIVLPWPNSALQQQHRLRIPAEVSREVRARNRQEAGSKAGRLARLAPRLVPPEIRKWRAAQKAKILLSRRVSLSSSSAYI